MQLRDARLGDAEHLADLAQRQLLVVVERDDELLALGQAGDRLAERLPHLGLRERSLRLRALRVLDRVDQGDLVAAGRHGPELVERRDRRARDLGQAVVELLLGDAALRRDLLVGRRAVQLLLELGDRALDVARASAHGARHPVERAQLVDDRALDARDRVRLELDLAVGVEALDRADQPEQAVRDEIALVHVRRQAAAEAAGDELDERRVGQDQAVADRPVTRLDELLPELPGVVDLRHGKRIRRASPDSCSVPPQEPERHGRHPAAERRRGRSDHPLTRPRGRECDEPEPQRERKEEQSERVSLGEHPDQGYNSPDA